MPIITIKEASMLCGKSESNIHTYISRGKLKKRPDNTIDTTIPVNKIFFDKHKPKEVKSTGITLSDTPPPPPRKKASDPKEDGQFVTAFEMERLKAEKLEQEIIQLSLKNKRLEGDLIEFETVKQTTYEVINSYRTTNYQAAENVLKNNMKDLNCSNEQLTKAITDLQVLFNAACTEAIENVKLTLDKIL